MVTGQIAVPYKAKKGRCDKQKIKLFKIILDSGAQGNFMSCWLVSKNSETTSRNIVRVTINGEFITSAHANAQFTMWEFSNKNALDMKFSIMDERSLSHDMMLGKDALSDLSMKSCCEHDVVKWEKNRVLMKSKLEVHDMKNSQTPCSLCASVCHEDEPMEI